MWTVHMAICFISLMYAGYQRRGEDGGNPRIPFAIILVEILANFVHCGSHLNSFAGIPIPRPNIFQGVFRIPIPNGIPLYGGLAIGRLVASITGA